MHCLPVEESKVTDDIIDGKISSSIKQQTEFTHKKVLFTGV